MTRIFELALSGFWEFCGVFLLLSLLYSLFTSFVLLVVRLVNRWIRHLNIKQHGWPPAHLDADGDFKPEGE